MFINSYLSIYLSTYLPIYLSTYLSIYLSNQSILSYPILSYPIHLSVVRVCVCLWRNLQLHNSVGAFSRQGCHLPPRPGKQPPLAWNLRSLTGRSCSHLQAG